MEKTILIDGNLLLFKSFYATYYSKAFLKTTDGIPTNAIHSFLMTFFKLITELNPKYIFVAFDSPGPTFRHQFFKDYKGNREKMPSSLEIQFIWIKRILSAMKICWFEENLIEADDIIASMVKKINKQENEIFIYSSDKDLLQLIDKNISVITKWDKKNYIFQNENNFFENNEINPSQITDLKALSGDPSDNYLGIKGIGPKTAIKLLNEFNSVENLYANLSSVKDAIRTKLEDGKENAFLFKKLAILKNDVNLPFQIEECKLEHQCYLEAETLLNSLEMKNILNMYKKLF